MKDRQKVIKYIASVEKQLYALFGNTYEAALHLTEVRKAIETGDTFTWKGNPTAEKKIDRYLKDLSNKASVIIKNGIIGSWNKGEANAKVQVVEAFGKIPALRKEANDICDEAVKAHRAKGKTGHAFANTARGGMNISTRVWNLTGNAKQELETIIQNGILEGKSPDEVSRSVKGYLNEPNALFRRVRNKETGNLELSEAARKYHPGQGVYRSAYKNARRLAVTEMNAAFRRAEWESYQNNPLITGYEIRLSNNHTVVINGKIRTLYDICDILAGVYPKTFRWTGWHPQCRCEMIPILISENDFRTRIRARKEGKLYKWEAKQITTMPKGFNNWIEENAKRIASAKNIPYWIRDNYKNLDINNLLNRLYNKITEPIKPTVEAPVKAIHKKEEPKQPDIVAENKAKTEAKIGKKYGEPMTFEEANELRGNVNYKKGYDFRVNCQSCVVANELRRRGLDVTAYGNTRKPGSIPYELSYKTELAWIDPKTGKNPIKKLAGGTTSKIQMGRDLAKITTEPGRYHIDFVWKGTRSGHIITFERLRNGKIRIYDPQSGKIISWDLLKEHISPKWGIRVLRVDNLLVNTDIIKGVVY